MRGLAREAAHWGAFSELLKEQSFCQSVSFLELPGTGKFHKLTSPRSIDETAEFLLTQLPKDKKGVLLAISLGGMVAVELARKCPQYFEKLVIINSSFSNLSPFYHRLQLKTFKSFFKMARSQNLQQREFECLKMVSHSSEKWPALSQEFAQVARDRPVRVTNFLNQLYAASRYKIPQEPLATPLIIFNSRGDEMVDYRCSEALARHWKCPIHTHLTAGHDIPIDDPDWLIEKLEESLKTDP